ncbi:MAG: hypothetical protein JSR72_14090 [Proteobacteria bacterium]|nr:hypothetical protein [Pseudomonadota bacterium]
MRQVLTRALAIAVLSGAAMTAFADNVSIPYSAGIPYYARGPRIIHVPQPGEDLRGSEASLRGDTSADIDDDEATDVAPPPHRAMKPQSATHIHERPKTRQKERTQAVAKASPHREPRRKPYNVSLPEPPPPPPEPTGPRRALLSAPPPLSSLSDGPTPIRPTPRFGSPLPEPAASAPSLDDVTASAPMQQPAAAPVDTSDDHLPPPGDPRLAPPEPK